MRSEKQNGLIAAAAMAVAGCFCLLGMAQAARPLRAIGLSSATAFAVAPQQLTRHALSEVSPRGPHPLAPQMIGVRSAVAQRYVLPRMTVFVPLWPMENWPVHRRVSHASTDTPDPA